MLQKVMSCVEILFMLFYLRFGLVEAEDSICIVFREDNPHLPPFSGDEHSRLRVDYCSPKQKCCKTGCCSKENPVGYILFFGILIAGGLIYCCFRLCCNKCNENFFNDRSTQHEISPLRTNNQPEQSRNDENSQPGNYSGSQNRIYLASVPNEQEVHVENNSDPVTPPPSYDDAVCAPSAPPDPTLSLLRQENKIPSYEDVTSGKK
ncbi:hypothetical protein Zmor_000420 [Zophobas morio]|uniref:Vesicular, overexpressed in cancer, prosurvival protein 1 n=1 Tax=Zophobas morio TaxID=2755281 RepID=A0AA38MRG5_9CUCU|nr:hypothetical protein Zmor_000420 [Zophobas morio]